MIRIKNTNIEVEDAVHDHGIRFKNIKIPAGMRLLTATEVIALAKDADAMEKLNIMSGKNDFWIEQPFQQNTERGLAAWFGSNSFSLNLYSSSVLYISDAVRGVLFCRDVKKGEKK